MLPKASIPGALAGNLVLLVEFVVISYDYSQSGEVRSPEVGGYMGFWRGTLHMEDVASGRLSGGGGGGAVCFLPILGTS